MGGSTARKKPRRRAGATDRTRTTDRPETREGSPGSEVAAAFSGFVRRAERNLHEMADGADRLGRYLRIGASS